MIPKELIDYEKIRKSAAVRCGRLNIPKQEADDIAGDAYLLATRRSLFTHAEANANAVAATLMDCAIGDVIRKRIRSRVPTVRLDAVKTVTPDRDETNEDDDLVERGNAISDRGRAASRIRLAAGRDAAQAGAVPFWLQLFNAERQRLRDEGKRTELRVLKQLMKDSRLWVAKSELNISGLRFSRILKNFKVRFALSYRALREFRRQDRCPCFSSDKRLKNMWGRDVRNGSDATAPTLQKTKKEKHHG